MQSQAGEWRRAESSQAGRSPAELARAASAVPGAEKWAGLRARGCGSARPGRAEVAEGSRGSLREGTVPCWVVPSFRRCCPFPSRVENRERLLCRSWRKVEGSGGKGQVSSALELPGCTRSPPVSGTPQTFQSRTYSGSLFLGGLRALLLRGVNGSVKSQFDPLRAPDELVRAARASSIRRSARAELLLLLRFLFPCWSLVPTYKISPCPKKIFKPS